MLWRINFIFGPRARSAWKQEKPRLKLWISCYFSSTENILSKSDSSKFTSLRPFIVQIFVVAQLDSLIWVEVHFMMETMNQVLSNLEFGWIFKNSSQNSKGSLCHRTDIDMLALHVLEISLSNLSWPKSKSWSLHLGEEHIRSWLKFDLVLASKFEFPCWSSMCWHCYLRN
jgi:hypothetical protein